MFSAVIQSHLLELIKSYLIVSDGIPHGDIEPHPSQYPARDRLWCKARSITKMMRRIDWTDLPEGPFVETAKPVCPR